MNKIKRFVVPICVLLIASALFTYGWTSMPMYWFQTTYILYFIGITAFALALTTNISKKTGQKLTSLASACVLVLSAFLLTGFWTTYTRAPDIGFTVMGFYCLGSNGLLLMYRSHRHFRNPNLNVRKAWIEMFLGLTLVLVSYLTLNLMLMETRMF